jgi:hypothetical protein
MEEMEAFEAFDVSSPASGTGSFTRGRTGEFSAYLASFDVPGLAGTG